MNVEFTSWDAGLHTRDSNYLEQHGIPGMKWGVRRFQNSDGSLTPAGEKRYGASGTGGSARSMQRHFNSLDMGYANVAAERNAAQKSGEYHVKQYMKRGMKLAAKGYTPDQIKADKKRAKQFNKIMKDEKKYQLNDKQMKSIENLQHRILAKAAQKGYTTKSKAVVRYGNTAKERALANLFAVGVGGAVGGAAAGAMLGANGYKVNGQKVKIRKKGDGSTSIVNYAPLNAEERRRNRQNKH